MNKDQQIAAFEKHVKSLTRKFTMNRSSLKDLFAFLKAENAPTRFVDVQAVKNKCKNPQDGRLSKYDPALQLLQKVWGTTDDYRVPFPPFGTTAMVIRSVKQYLDVCKTYACSDVGTFAGDINQQLPKSRRDEIYRLGTSKGQSTGVAIVPTMSGGAKGDWNPEALEAAYSKVHGAKAGECTSFANFGAHVLSTLHPYVLSSTPRIEIVSFRNKRLVPRRNKDGTPLFKKDAYGNFTDQPVMAQQYVTHVFCLVGRMGDDVAYNQKMPDKSTWGAEARIVDCWLGALGFECSFTVDEYPRMGYLTTGYLFKEMDSRAGARAVN